MKLQDLHPFDETILGLDGIYHTVGADSFYINSPCILAIDKTVSTGKTYILVDNPQGTGIKMSDVKLLDAYYKDGLVYLFVQDVNTQRIFTIDICIECHKNECTSMLVDSDYFVDKINADAIKSYCTKCKDSHGNPNAEEISKFSDEDLLEFDF